MSNVVDLLETRYYYSSVFILSFVFYFYSSITKLENKSIDVFPNFIFFFFVFLSGMLMSLSMQEIDHQDVSLKGIFIDLLVSPIPFVLVLIALNRIIRRERDKNNDQLFIFGLIILRFTLILLSLFYVFTLALIIIIGFHPSLILLLFLPLYGLLGFEFGMHVSKIREQPSKALKLLQIFMAKLVGTRNRRILISLINLILLLILNILGNFMNFNLIEI